MLNIALSLFLHTVYIIRSFYYFFIQFILYYPYTISYSLYYPLVILLLHKSRNYYYVLAFSELNQQVTK